MGFKCFKVKLSSQLEPDLTGWAIFMVIFVFAFLLRAQSYLPPATCSAVAWNGWNGSPGEAGNEALVLPASSFSPSFSLARPPQQPAGQVTGHSAAAAHSLHILRYNAILIIGRKASITDRRKIFPRVS